MQKTKILLSFIIVLTISFIGLQIFNQDQISSILRAFVLPLLTILYWIKFKDNRSYFFYFLLAYSISEFMGVFGYLAYTSQLIGNILFYSGNGFYILAYVFLIIEILKSMDLKGICKRFPLPLIILFAFDVYSIILVSDVAMSSNMLNKIEYTVEIVYNISIMLLLTVTFINYISRHTKKAMNLLVGAICIVFSEVMQVASYYVSDINLLKVLYSILLVFAFSFFYIQSSMNYADEKKFKPLEKLEA
jgi:hypothetical protein